MKYALAGAVGLAGLILFRRPVKWLGRTALRSALALPLLWLLRGVGAHLGISLGVNLLNALVLGVLGGPGLALLLMTQWIAG